MTTMEIERWVKITIYLVAQKSDGSPDHHAPKKVLSSFDLPRELYERRQWVIVWRLAWWQCRYPRRYLWSGYHYYDKKTGQDLMDPTYNRIQTCRRMVTKLTNSMRKYEGERARELIWEKDRDPQWQQAVAKLKAYQEELNQLQNMPV